MAEHVINFVEGEGISIQAAQSADGNMWNVEIANTIGGLIDQKGDLVAGSGDDTAAALPVGSDGQVLTADSTADTGLAWADAAGGGASTATAVSITDTADYYTSTNVEGALAELGAELAVLVEWEDTGGGGTSGAWLPLTTTNASGDDVLVFDADHSLIPTLVPF